MTTPRFTVLLPTHNRPEVLRFAIQSVLAQTLEDFELLIAGDGCTDSTAELVASFRDPRIRWLDLPKTRNFGYATRNVALRQASGELIAYMAHDDLWLPDHLELLSSAIEKHASELAYSQLLQVSPDGVIIPRIANLNDERTMARLMTLEEGLGITCVIHRRSCLEKYGWWDESLPRGGDAELWRRIITGGNRRRFTYLPIPTALNFISIARKQSWKNKLKSKAYVLEGSLPPELTIPIPKGMLEQKVLWDLLQRGALDLDVLRRSVQLHLDRLASGAYPSTLLAFLDQRIKRLSS
jgi:glycosyltransferase involved in cell wall biosynthesis